MNGARDVLERLLPDVDADLAQRARRMATFLRLLHTEARSRAAASVGVDLQRARAELERDRRAAAAAVLTELALQHLETALGPASFVSLPRARLAPRRAWARLEELRGSGLALPQVSAPDEPAVAVAGRMLAGLEQMGAAGCSARRLAAACERARGGPAAGERAFERLFHAAATPTLRAAALVGRVESALDRGGVSRAAALLAASGVEAGAVRSSGRAQEDELTARLAWLGCWVALLSGRVPVSAGPGSAALLPTPLVELRRRRPEWSRYLCGRVRRAHRPPAAERVDWSGARRAHGALVLAIFTVGPRGEAELVEADVEPDLRPRLEAWSAGARPERAALAAGRSWLRHRGAQPLPGTLSPRTASLAAWPVEAAGPGDWIWAEFEHHLLPTTRRLRALAHSLGAQRARQPRSVRPAADPCASVRERARGAGADVDSPVLRATIEELVRGLAVKTRERRWWGIELEAGGPRVVVSGGGAGAPREPARGRLEHCGLARALRFREVLRFERASDLALDPSSACGLLVPVVSRGSSLGALVFESERRGDFGAAWVARVASRVQAGAERWRLARFRDWHRARRGRDVLFGLEEACVVELLDRVLGAASAVGPVAVSGPPGAGKTVAASWVHFERAGADAPFEELIGTGETTWAALRRGLERAAGGTLCVEGLERLPARNRARLLESSARLVATCEGRSLAAVADAGALPRAVARALERDEVSVPALAARRADVPALARLFVRESALELGLGPIEIGERAAAWLWRQPWRENVRQLENLLRRCAPALAPAAPGDRACLDLDLLERVARRQGFEGVSRVPPGTAPAEIVRAALEVTRTPRGAIHRGRAALYLGWHPDTLARRARALEPGAR